MPAPTTPAPTPANPLSPPLRLLWLLLTMWWAVCAPFAPRAAAAACTAAAIASAVSIRFRCASKFGTSYVDPKTVLGSSGNAGFVIMSPDSFIVTAAPAVRSHFRAMKAPMTVTKMIARMEPTITPIDALRSSADASRLSDGAGVDGAVVAVGGAVVVAVAIVGVGVCSDPGSSASAWHCSQHSSSRLYR